MDPPSAGRCGFGPPFLGPFADDRLEGSDTGFDLHQHHIGAAIEADVGRPTPRSRHRRLQRRMPAGVALAKDRLDDACVRRVVDQWRTRREDRDPEIRAQGRACTCADPR